MMLVGGWPTPLKNDGVKVSWDDDIPNWMENKSHVPNHQPAMIDSMDGFTRPKPWPPVAVFCSSVHSIPGNQSFCD